MRQALAVLALLTGCGEIVKTAIDAPPVEIDAAADAPLPVVPRLYALTSGFGQGATLYGLEIVDLTTMTTVARHALGAGTVSSLVVSPDGNTAYIADRAAAEIHVVDTTTGSFGTPIPLAQVRDLVLSADGSTLFAAASDTLVAIDTTTRAQTPSLSLGANAISLGLALSPDGQRLATATSAAAVSLVRASDMSIEGAVPITTTVTGCASQPTAVAFKDGGVLVVWDGNCDALYQVDVGTRTQLAQSINTGRDSGTGGFPTSRLALSGTSRLAYAVREDDTLAVMNPQTATSTLADGFLDTPWAVVSSVTGAKIYVSVIHQFAQGGADTLDVLDTANSGFERSAYTFMSATQSVLDMAVVAAQ